MQPTTLLFLLIQFRGEEKTWPTTWPMTTWPMTWPMEQPTSLMSHRMGQPQAGHSEHAPAIADRTAALAST